MAYAEKTTVPIEKTQMEIKKILNKYQASSFGLAEGKGKASIFFDMANRRFRFDLPLPPSPSEKATAASIRTYDQICRSRWRSLLLGIKAKLECVDSGITTLEKEFLAHVVLPDGSTVGDSIAPQLVHSYETKEMPPLLGWGGA